MTLTETEKAIALRVAVNMGWPPTEDIVEFASRFLDEIRKSAEPVAVVTAVVKQQFYECYETGELTIAPLKGMKQSGLQLRDKLYLHPPAPQPDLQDEAREMIERLRWLSDKIAGDYGSELGHRALSAATLIEKLAGLK